MNRGGMIALGHTGSGALVGLAAVSTLAEVPAPLPLALLIVLLSGIATHYIGDWLPHGHYRFNSQKLNKSEVIKLSVDLLLPVLLILILAINEFEVGWEFTVILAALAGVHLPDIFENLIDLKILPNTAGAKEHRKFHYDILHWHNDRAKSNLPHGARPLKWVDIYQLAFLVAPVYLLV